MEGSRVPQGDDGRMKRHTGSTPAAPLSAIKAEEIFDILHKKITVEKKGYCNILLDIAIHNTAESMSGGFF